MSERVSVVLAGGGSAGHISPALATAAALHRLYPDVRLTFLGTERGLETRLIPDAGHELRLIPPVPLPRKLTPALLAVPVRVRKAVAQTRTTLSDVGADVVVGFGGYVSLPAYLAARGRTPTVVHEANPKPGLANRVGARFATVVAVSGEDTPLRNARLVGIPLRREVATLDRLARRAEARRHFGLDPDRPTLLVTGGSQGARSINTAATGAAAALREAGVQVLHVVGPKNTDVTAPAGSPPYVVLPYLDKMELGYAAADVALCRAGAITCAELACVGLPAAYVPLPIGNGEQRVNAGPILDAGGGLLVDDQDLNPGWVREHLLPVLTDAARVRQMSEAARRVAHADADETLARLIMRAAGR